MRRSERAWKSFRGYCGAATGGVAGTGGTAIGGAGNDPEAGGTAAGATGEEMAPGETGGASGAPADFPPRPSPISEAAVILPVGVSF